MSLLKRIEQGQSSEAGSKLPGQGQPGGNSDNSRLSSLQTRRTSAPITSPQAGSYLILRPVFKTNFWQNLIHPWTLPEQMK